LYNGLYSLEAEITEDKFKSYDELKKKFFRVIGSGSESDDSFTAESVSAPVTKVSEIASEAPWSGDGNTDVAEEDDTMSYFSKLAEA